MLFIDMTWYVCMYDLYFLHFLESYEQQLTGNRTIHIYNMQEWKQWKLNKKKKKKKRKKNFIQDNMMHATNTYVNQVNQVKFEAVQINGAVQ